jgi:hypothetical protein
MVKPSIAVLFTGLMILQGCLQGALPDLVSGGVSDYPKRAEIGEPITISWWNAYPPDMELTHSAIHYGYFSHPGELGLNVNPNDLEYQGVVEVFPERLRSQNNTFSITLVPHQKGALYFRAHTVLDRKHYWSEELRIEVE